MSRVSVPVDELVGAVRETLRVQLRTVLDLLIPEEHLDRIARNVSQCVVMSDGEIAQLRADLAELLTENHVLQRKLAEKQDELNHARVHHLPHHSNR